MSEYSAEQLWREILATEERLATLKGQLDRKQRSCQQHQWGKIKYEPIIREAYTIPGDPPGTMGVDWQGPCHVPAQTTHQWSRTCALCVKKETTQHTRKERTAGTIPGTSGEVDVPDFSYNWSDKPTYREWPMLPWK